MIVVEIGTVVSVCARSESGEGTRVILRPGEEYEATSFTIWHVVVKIPDWRGGFLLAEVPHECVRAVYEGLFLPEFEAAAAD